ncbi:LutC/YkgG family protein [Pedobacter punctiformis]|uniref:LUD domain-containing protein n=1 Tax=Pedobacter punctiformis TaxID=3004097 RepID=A0ABT4L936_9SPHI|nr:LUD domain-containing protein [Pedobacter sp. HCMS5-2]MCZ4244438.1 LUD domain-containing protein [Pedobacter sp. HCMS5-2]
MAIDSREIILKGILEHKPKSITTLPDLNFSKGSGEGLHKFIASASFNGSKVYRISGLTELRKYVRENFSSSDKILTTIAALNDIAKQAEFSEQDDPHDLEDVDLTILKAQLGVAENGALWLTEELLGHRVLPFITQHLILILNENEIVSSMNDAYQKIGDQDYNYGVFISGPSKTADIEQSLVIGAHGARSLGIFMMQEN